MLRNEYYFGGILGRDTNWIKNGRFTLDGRSYQITLTDPPNTIHGGKRGFDKRVWTVVPLAISGAVVSARLTYTSPDGEEGFLGTVTHQSAIKVTNVLYLAAWPGIMRHET